MDVLGDAGMNVRIIISVTPCVPCVPGLVRPFGQSDSRRWTVNLTTLAELQQIVLSEAQKSLHVHAGYNGAVRIHSVPETSGLPNWTIEAFDSWSPNFEGCRGALSIAEQALKSRYRVLG